MSEAQPHWERAETKLRQQLGGAAWGSMKQTISHMTAAARAE